MSDKSQHHSSDLRLKMWHCYGEIYHHKHNKQHLLYAKKQKHAKHVSTHQPRWTEKDLQEFTDRKAHMRWRHPGTYH